MAVAGHDDRVDDRRALAGVGMADEEPVLADGRRSDRIFDQVIVEPGFTVAPAGVQTPIMAKSE